MSGLTENLSHVITQVNARYLLIPKSTVYIYGIYGTAVTDHRELPVNARNETGSYGALNN